MAIKTDKTVFYHIPKTGGIWVKKALWRGGVNYGRCKEIHSTHWLRREHSVPELVAKEHKDGMFSFCFVRHPVEWYISFWCYRLRSKILDLRSPADWHWQNVFEEFVIDMLRAHPTGFITNLYQCYIGRNADQIDFIGRQEYLADDLVKALTIAGEKFDEQELRKAPWMNVAGGKKKLRHFATLSDETRDRVIESENWVMDKFYA